MDLVIYTMYLCAAVSVLTVLFSCSCHTQMHSVMLCIVCFDILLHGKGVISSSNVQTSRNTLERILALWFLQIFPSNENYNFPLHSSSALNVKLYIYIYNVSHRTKALANIHRLLKLFWGMLMVKRSFLVSISLYIHTFMYMQKKQPCRLQAQRMRKGRRCSRHLSRDSPAAYGGHHGEAGCHPGAHRGPRCISTYSLWRTHRLSHPIL